MPDLAGNSRLSDDGSAVEVALWATKYGETETGVWCERCALPSAVRIVGVVGSGDSVLVTVTSTGCPECGALAQEQRSGWPE